MALIEWKSEYALGIPAVDYEHRELIALINDLHGKRIASADDPDVSGFLGEVYARISAHFALEERLMREGAYAHFRSHKEDHERLLDEFRDLMDDHEDGALFDAGAFSVRLERWFTDHFKTHDARLHHWAR